MLKILDFYADWCAPCKRLKPIIQEIEKERKDINIEYVNVNEHPEKAALYDVKSVPTVLFLKEDSILNRMVGLVSKDAIVSTIEELK